MFDIAYNGVCGRELGVFVAHRPDIPAPTPRYTDVVIPGRDGSICHRDGSYADISIKVELHFAARPDLWHPTVEAVRRWLLTQQESEAGKLTLGDDSQWYYKVKTVEMGDTERELRRIGKTQVTFLCDPYKYLAGGERRHTYHACKFNPFDTCHPIYCVQVNGTCLINEAVEVTHTGAIVLDSDLMLAYDYGGTEANRNACVTGDYTSLWLNHGNTKLGISGAGTLEWVIPNWRAL